MPPPRFLAIKVNVLSLLEKQYFDRLASILSILSILTAWQALKTKTLNFYSSSSSTLVSHHQDVFVIC